MHNVTKENPAATMMLSFGLGMLVGMFGGVLGTLVVQPPYVEAAMSRLMLGLAFGAGFGGFFGVGLAFLAAFASEKATALVRGNGNRETWATIGSTLLASAVLIFVTWNMTFHVFSSDALSISFLLGKIILGVLLVWGLIITFVVACIAFGLLVSGAVRLVRRSL